MTIHIISSYWIYCQQFGFWGHWGTGIISISISCSIIDHKFRMNPIFRFNIHHFLNEIEDKVCDEWLCRVVFFWRNLSLFHDRLNCWYNETGSDDLNPWDLRFGARLRGNAMPRLLFIFRRHNFFRLFTVHLPAVFGLRLSLCFLISTRLLLSFCFLIRWLYLGEFTDWSWIRRHR